MERLGTCAPCFREYNEFQKQVQWRGKAACPEMAAAVVRVVLSFAWWGWHSRHPVAITAQDPTVAYRRDRLT